MKFPHLHVHSDYSLLDGAVKISSLAAKAAKDGMEALALTDHGVMFGAMEFYAACKEHKIKPIIGVEGYITLRGRKDRKTRDENHITLLAADEEGYRNLIALTTKSFTEGFYYKPRIDLDLLAQHQAGVICLSGCLSGLVQEPLLRGDYATAKTAAQTYKDIFGDRFYLEVMRHGMAEQNKIEAGMLQLSNELGVPLAATNDCHYLHKEDHVIHDAILCIGTGKTIVDEKRMRFDGHEFYLKTSAEMQEAFADLPQAITGANEIAQRCNLEISNKGFHIPAFPVPMRAGEEKPVDPDTYLHRLCLAGLKKRYGDHVQSEPVLLERLEYELSVIKKMGFASYFLIVWDFIKWARQQNIPVGPGRGSAVGSIASYCLRITDLDPIKYGLMFERFLNPDRISMPDIDTDFCIERREDVIDYVREKYGKDRVAQIITFGTMGAKMAIRDCGRILDMPIPLVGKIAALIPGGPKGLTIAVAREKIKDLHIMEEADPQIKALLDMASHIEGMVRHPSTHASGVVITDAPLENYVPLARLPDGSIDIQYDMDWIEKLGLLKMDFLGLRNLTVMEECANWIRTNAHPNFDLMQIPDDDQKTFAMLADGDTTGVFQMESDGIRRVLRNMRPDKLDDLVVTVALYRPGPMEWIPLYVDGKNGKRKPIYAHPALEPILAPTYGVPIFQEQIMEMARAIAGFSLSEADELRKVVGKKIPEKMPIEKKKFIEGAIKNNVDQKTAEAIFAFIEPFAGYGFNKAHALAYGWIAYQTAYLKANYPLPYFCALLNSVKEKSDKTVEYLAECALKGVTVLPPDVNESGEHYSVAGEAIRFGLSAIKGIGIDTVRQIVADRTKNGPFEDLDDLARRTRGAHATRKTLETMIKVGACDTFAPRGALLASLGPAADRAGLDAADEQTGQQSFLDILGTGPKAAPKPILVTDRERLRWEKNLLGYYVTGHPLDAVADLLKTRGAHSIREARDAHQASGATFGNPIRVGGLVSQLRRFHTKAGAPMLSGLIEDRTGSVRIVLFSRNFQSCEAPFLDGSIVLVDGKLKSQSQLNKNAEEEMTLDLCIDAAEAIYSDTSDFNAISEANAV